MSYHNITMLKCTSAAHCKTFQSVDMFLGSHVNQTVVGAFAGTHRPNRWTSEVFGETRLGTNLFSVFSCIGSFWSRVSFPVFM